MSRIAAVNTLSLKVALATPLWSLQVTCGAAVTTSACEKLAEPCTEIGCSDGLSVAFEHGRWVPGHYRFEISLDDNDVTCDVDLPLPASPGSVCTDDQVLLGLSGSALPDSEHEITGVELTGLHPKTVSIVVLRDDEELGRGEFLPEYKRVAPNGEECGPICEQASAMLKF